MKIRFLLLLAVACTAFATGSFASRPAPTPSHITYLDFLRAHRQGSGIALSWSFSVEGIDHYLVERSFDGEFFDKLTTTPTGSRTSRLLDVPPYAGTIHYRVTAVDAGGNALSVSTTAVRIVQRG